MKYILVISLLLMVDFCKHTPDKVSSNLTEQKQIVSQSNGQAKADALCTRLSEIKDWPFDLKEGISDEVLDGLFKQGELSIPCLIDKLTDTAKMKDPRSDPTNYSDFRVGDAAFFLLLEITDVSLEEMLPASLKKNVKDNGVYAYFEYVEKQQNRKLLQQKWQEWLKHKQESEPHR